MNVFRSGTLAGFISANGALQGGRQCKTGLVIRGVGAFAVFCALLTVSVSALGQAATSISITSDGPDPSIETTAFNVFFNLVAAGDPTGTITVSDGMDSCVATLPTNYCVFNPSSAGDINLTASYSGDASFQPATSGPEPHSILFESFPERVSIGNGEVTTQDPSAASSSGDVSADGRFVVFQSNARNLVEGGADGGIFLYDVASGSVARLPSSLSAFDPTISDDGRFVAFRESSTSLVRLNLQTMSEVRLSIQAGGPHISGDGSSVVFYSSNRLVANDTNSFTDVYVYDYDTGEFDLITLSDTGAPADGNSFVTEGDSISFEGDIVGFFSDASNLVPSDTNNSRDSFHHDRATGSTTRLNVFPNGSESTSFVGIPSLSGDGNVVVFYSGSSLTGSGNGVFIRDLSAGTYEHIQNSNGMTPRISADGMHVSFGSSTQLVAADQNGKTDVYMLDRADGAIEWVSEPAANAPARIRFPFFWPGGLSGGGEVVTFSGTQGLVPEDQNDIEDFYVRLPAQLETRRVSEGVTIAHEGNQTNGFSFRPDLSRSGRYVAFDSTATSLTLDDPNALVGVFRFDRENDTVISASAKLAGGPGNDFASEPSITLDGQAVLFASRASDLVANDTNFSDDIFLRDLATGSLELVSVDGNGNQVNGQFIRPEISGNGNAIVFSTGADLGEGSGRFQIYHKDLGTGAVTRLSEAADGSPGDDSSTGEIKLSADGTVVAFGSRATNLVPGDDNGTDDVFVVDLGTNSLSLASAAADGTPGNGRSSRPVVSEDGRFVAFDSQASNLVPGDDNGLQDVFLLDRDTDSLVRIGEGGFSPGLSEDGRYVSMIQGGRVVVWDQLTSRFGQVLPSIGYSTVEATISADGAVVALRTSSILVVDDTNGQSDIYVAPVVFNQDPIAQADTLTANEDTGGTGNVLADNGNGADSDLDADPLSISDFTYTDTSGMSETASAGSAVSPQGGGTLTVSANGDVSFLTNNAYETLGTGETAAVSFTYTLSDSNGGSDTAMVIININGVDDMPVAMNDAATVDEDSGSTTIDVLANDTDIDGGPMAIDSVTQPNGGTVNITGGGSGLTYQPDPNFCNDGTPTDDFSYTLAPGGSTATVAVTVTCVNDAPVANAGTTTTDEDNEVTITLNGSDIEGDALTFAIATGPINGSLGAIMPINATTAEVTYTPNSDFNGSDSFTFTVNDGTLDSAAATVSITINAVDDPPIALDDTATVNEDDPATAINVLANDTDIDGGPVAIDSVTQPAGGTVTITGGGSGLTYQPDPDFCNDGSPTDDFSYTLTPGGSTATVAVTVSCVNDAPVADAGTATTDEDTGVTITLTGSDIDGDALTFAIATGPTDGSLGGITPINATTAQVTYTPNPDFNGSDSFTFTVNDGMVGSAAAMVDITINAVDDPPIALNDTATVNEDDPATAIDVLANDTDIDGGPIAIDSVTQPASGTVNITGGGSTLTYQPDVDFCNDGTPTDDFSYTLAPGGSTATVAVTVTCVNDAPVADAGTATTDEDTGVTITLTGSDIDGDALTFAIATGPANGSLSAIMPINDTTAEVTYTPDADFNGSDSFTFTVNDGTVDSIAATVEITVEAVNDPPTFVAGGDVAEIEDGDFSEPWASAISPGPADESGQTVSFLVTDNTNPGLFAAAPAIDPAGTLTFTPTPDTTGSATIEIMAMDNGGTANGGNDLSDPVTFVIDVIAAADLAIDKTSGTFFTLPGGTLSYELVVTNPGPSDVVDARVEDPEPARLTFGNWQCAPAGLALCNTAMGSGPVDVLVTIPQGDSVTVTVDAQILDTDTVPVTNTATVTAPNDVIELNASDNTDSDTDLMSLFADGMESVEP